MRLAGRLSDARSGLQDPPGVELSAQGEAGKSVRWEMSRFRFGLKGGRYSEATGAVVERRNGARAPLLHGAAPARLA